MGHPTDYLTSLDYMYSTCLVQARDSNYLD